MSARPATARRRGRPAGQMTTRRRQILAAWEAMAARGGPVSVSRIARECGLYGRQDAKRILADLRRMGMIADRMATQAPRQRAPSPANDRA